MRFVRDGGGSWTIRFARVRAKMAGQQPAEEPRPTSVPVLRAGAQLQALQRPPGVGRGRASGTRCPPNSDFGGHAPLSRSSGSELAGWPTARHVRNTRPVRASPSDPQARAVIRTALATDRLAGFGHPAHNLRPCSRSVKPVTACELDTTIRPRQQRSPSRSEAVRSTTRARGSEGEALTR